MENSTPLTRCDTCHTVFEVPRAILESVDSRVRCGECLQVFDASINLHNAHRPDFSLIDETLVEGGVDSVELAKKTSDVKEAATVGGAAVALAGAAGVHAKTLAATKDTVTEARADTIQDETDENHLEATMSDFDLFSDDASLPEVSYEFGENTIDAIRLRFDEVEDLPDETLSDSLFANEATIDASGLGDTTDVAAPAARNLTDAASTRAPVSGSESAGKSDSQPLDDVLRESAKTGFVVEEGRKPETVEFDFSADAVVPVKGTAATHTAAVSSKNPGVKGADVPVPEIASGEAAKATQADASAVSELPDIAPVSAASAAGDETGLLVDSGIGAQPLVGKRGSRYLVPGLLLLLTTVLIAALYGYRERNNLADNRLTRPAYLAWCGIKGCKVPARLDKSQLKVVEKNIFSHPTLDDALVITVLLENNADFSQRYPALFVWLSDSGRRTVAENQFEAVEYLPENGLALDSVMAPGQQQQISIDVRDPGRRAVSLELNLR